MIDSILKFMAYTAGILFVLAAIGATMQLTGCDQAEMKKTEMNYNVAEMSRKMNYYKDTNTNLCFAAMNIDMQSATMTNVPCTPEVEKLAHSFMSGK
jgi:hypothetical protein